jgi:hypothetical protein
MRAIQFIHTLLMIARLLKLGVKRAVIDRA